MDITAVQAMMSSLKAATDVAKALFDLKTTAEVQGKVIEIQSALLAAQSSALAATNAQYELQDRVRALETQLKSFEDWGTQKVRYALANPWKGPAQVYALKKDSAEDELPHYLCSHCFHGGRRVILNPTSKDGWVHMTCPACKAVTATGYRGVGPPKFAEDCARQD